MRARPVAAPRRGRRRLGGALCAVLATAACHAGARGPAWPKSAGKVAVDDWKEDGGQSLAPAGGTAPLEAAADRRELLATLTEPALEGASAPAAASEATVPVTDQDLLDALDAIELQETIVIEIDD